MNDVWVAKRYMAYEVWYIIGVFSNPTRAMVRCNEIAGERLKWRDRQDEKGRVVMMKSMTEDALWQYEVTLYPVE